MNTDVLSVRQINYYIKSILDGDKNLKNVFIKGEVSNFKKQFPSGNFYFSLKDEVSSVACVMFSSYAQNLRFEPNDGEQVLLRCDVSLFEKTGTYQLYVRDMQKIGLGDLNLSFNLLKEKLQKEGLFEEAHKKALPEFPENIAVLSSKTGAVIEDIKKVLSSRYKLATIMLYPVYVQGVNSAQDIISGIRYFNENKIADVIIIARGGGSEEDLSAFNDEALVRAVYASDIPVVSAVGHETDFTLCDYVADVRASTPSVAAEMVSPDSSELLFKIANSSACLDNLINYKISDKYQSLLNLTNKLNLLSPKSKLLNKKYMLDSAKNKLDNIMSSKLENYKNLCNIHSTKLELTNPYSILKRGYSLAFDRSHSAIKSINQVRAGEDIELRILDGKIKCKVISVEEEV